MHMHMQRVAHRDTYQSTITEYCCRYYYQMMIISDNSDTMNGITDVTSQFSPGH